MTFVHAFAPAEFPPDAAAGKRATLEFLRDDGRTDVDDGVWSVSWQSDLARTALGGLEGASSDDRDTHRIEVAVRDAIVGGELRVLVALILAPNAGGGGERGREGHRIGNRHGAHARQAAEPVDQRPDRSPRALILEPHHFSEIGGVRCLESGAFLRRARRTRRLSCARDRHHRDAVRSEPEWLTAKPQQRLAEQPRADEQHQRETELRGHDGAMTPAAAARGLASAGFQRVVRFRRRDRGRRNQSRQ